MKKITSFVILALMIPFFVFGASAKDLDVALTGKTVITLGDWSYEKINNDTQCELDEYIGEGGEVIVPRVFGEEVLVVRIGDHCFSNNTNVTSVITSSPLWTVGEYAFVNCTSLENFECNYALKTIMTGAFSGTSSLKTINLEDSVVTSIAPYAFLNSGIEEITLPDTCTTLEGYSFAQCDQLLKIMIPASVTEIADTAFSKSENIVIYCYTDSVAHRFAETNDIEYVLLDAPVEVTFILGDADHDGVISVLDATIIQKCLASIITDEDGWIHTAGSVDGLALNISHATYIQKYLACITVPYEIGTQVTRVVES